MAYSLNFDHHMKRALDELIPKLTWTTGWYLKGQHWRVDVTGLEGKHPRVFVEAELKKDDPAANVIKIWRWACDSKNTKRILFVQGFSKLYWQAKVRKRERAEFVGERMAEAGLRIDYKSRPIRYRNKNGQWVHYTPKSRRGFHAKEGAGRLKQAAQGLAEDVARLFHSA
jgi:hypothetical protein